MVNSLGNENELNNASRTIIDMLVHATLNKHEAKLDTKKIDEKTKKELRKLVKDLEKDVQSLSKKSEEEE